MDTSKSEELKRIKDGVIEMIISENHVEREKANRIFEESGLNKMMKHEYLYSYITQYSVAYWKVNVHEEYLTHVSY